MSEPMRSTTDTIPADLTELDQWVLWKYEARDGKTTKIPYQPDHQRASTTSKLTWRSYAEVCAAYNRNGRSFSGIGFVFTPDDPYLGIDLDNCLEGGTLKSWAGPIIEAFADTYSEISPSGNGVKIFVKGRLPGKGHRKDFGDHAVELYDRGRFFAITGKAFNGAPLEIEEHQADIDRLYRVICGSSTARTTLANGSGKIPQGSDITHL
jgi:putative DNA primase/helicase